MVQVCHFLSTDISGAAAAIQPFLFRHTAAECKPLAHEAWSAFTALPLSLQGEVLRAVTLPIEAQLCLAPRSCRAPILQAAVVTASGLRTLAVDSFVLVAHSEALAAINDIQALHLHRTGRSKICEAETRSLAATIAAFTGLQTLSLTPSSGRGFQRAVVDALASLSQLSALDLDHLVRFSIRGAGTGGCAHSMRERATRASRPPPRRRCLVRQHSVVESPACNWRCRTR